MNVSKISILNVNNSGVSLFKGDTPVLSEKQEKSKDKKNIATKFLYGAGAVSAGILVVALAARAGLFYKSKNIIDDVSGLTDRVKDDLLRFDSKPVEKRVIPMFGEQQDRIKTGAVNLDKIKSVIDYSKFAKYKTQSEQTQFFENIYNSLENLSYENQYEEFGYFLDFLKRQKPSDIKVKINFNIDNYKRDNKFRISRKLMEFSNQKPEYNTHLKDFIAKANNYFVDYSKYSSCITDGQKAGFFTNTENKIRKMPRDIQIEEFSNYLNFLKTLDPKDTEGQVLFRIGRYSDNYEIAKRSVQFAKDNPDMQDKILSNLISYEPDEDFARDLAYANFYRADHLAQRYDMNIDNIIKIRNLLIDSGLKCNKNTQMKNRHDWIEMGMPTSNNYMLGFQYSSRLPELRKAAFEYDLMNGITEKDADILIKKLSADISVAKKSPEEVFAELKDTNIPEDKAKELFNILIDCDSQLKKQVENVNFTQIPREDYDNVIGKLSSNAENIRKKTDSVFEELKNYGIPREKSEYIYKQLTSTKDKTDTEEKYGMKLEEMINKIQNAIISEPEEMI